jgi:hypothetical protein
MELVELIVDKHRGDPTGTARVTFHPSRTLFVHGLRRGGVVIPELAAARGSALAEVRVEAWRVLGVAICGGPRNERDEAWKAVLVLLSVLGTERTEGWKGIAAAIGVSITRARELADRRRPFRLPVRCGARGVYITRVGLALWLAQYDAPYGAHEGLRQSQRPSG